MNISQTQRREAFGGLVGIGCSSNRDPTTKPLNPTVTTPVPTMNIIKITHSTVNIHFVRSPVVCGSRAYSVRGADGTTVTV